MSVTKNGCIVFFLIVFFLLFPGTKKINAIELNKENPNIILIVSDDHGTDALGCYGNPVIKTPFLDALAEEGTRFTNAFCTTPSCSPSRSVILTGKHNHNNGMYRLEHSYHHFSSFDHVKR